MAHRYGWFVWQLMSDIVLATINAKWIHPSLALRLLKANLGHLEDQSLILEFALRQPLAEKTEPLLAASPRILAFSVSIWNHLATIELLEELEENWRQRPVVVLGGPEVSFLPPQAEIFRYANYVIRGEGEEAFRTLCENILADGIERDRQQPQFINAQNVNLNEIKTAYHLYTDEDLEKKLVYVEASRGCPFNCEFCLSAVKDGNAVREFPLDPFLEEMNALVRRGAKTFKFLDRTFNINIERALKIIEFFLEKIEERKQANQSLVVHFEMVPSLFSDELLAALSRFQPGTLRLEIGIQTLNGEVATRINRRQAENELETLRFLREKTNAIIHADLIAGLPGEDIASFGRGFDRLWSVLRGKSRAEIQIGILKLLPGAPISRHNDEFCMRYNPAPPYEIEETSVMNADDISRIKNFARFWEVIVNRGLADFSEKKTVFEEFINLSDLLYSHFGRNWGIDRDELLSVVMKYRF
jgi:radical SAM superfamily enzyme YgiQ (UPF0313 family)